MIFTADLRGSNKLPHDSTPVPTQATWSAETTNNVQEDAAKSSLGKYEFHKVLPRLRSADAIKSRLGRTVASK